MDVANDEDLQAIQSRSAAMSRFHLIHKVDCLLRKKHHMIHFLENGGCSVLEKWLLENPDGSYPSH